jgi:hypothetical protein
MRWIGWAAAFGACMAAAPVARAQDTPFHLGQAATACANPRAATALEDPQEPRRADPSWVAFVVSDGRCVRIEAGAPVSVLGQAGGLSQIEYPRGSGQRLFVAGTALLPDASPPAEEAKPAAGWTNASSGSGQDAACVLSGPAGPGTLAMSASADRPGVVRVIVSKPSWRVPPQTPARLSAAFSGMAALTLNGTGQGTSLEFALTDGFKAWLHGFTASASGTLSFPGAAEGPWQLNLAGTSAAASALAECVRASGIISAPPPFASASAQPPTGVWSPPPASAASRPALPETSRPAVAAGSDPASQGIELPPIRP